MKITKSDFFWIKKHLEFQIISDKSRELIKKGLDVTWVEICKETFKHPFNTIEEAKDAFGGLVYLFGFFKCYWAAGIFNYRLVPSGEKFIFVLTEKLDYSDNGRNIHIVWNPNLDDWDIYPSRN